MRCSCPTQASASSCTRPCLIRPMQQVRAAWAQPSPRGRPLSAQRPLGTSMAINPSVPCRLRACSRAPTGPSSGRRWPMPNRASSHTAGSAGSGGCSRVGMPSQRAWRQWAAVRGLWRSNGLQIRTAMPASCSSRATTSPSPPLWPGPTSTRAPRCCSCRHQGEQRSSAVMARAAFSIRASTGSPLANSCSSSAAIWAELTSRWALSRLGQGRSATAGLGGAVP